MSDGERLGASATYPAGSLVVVVASDGSPNAMAAAETAAVLFGDSARFEIVTVAADPIDPTSDATGFAGPTLRPDEVAELNAARRVEADAVTAATARRLGPQPAAHRVLHGDPAESLRAHARDVDADVIVVGSSGRGRTIGTVLGSVAWRLIGEADRPLLVVPAPEGHAAAGGG